MIVAPTPMGHSATMNRMPGPGHKGSRKYPYISCWPGPAGPAGLGGCCSTARASGAVGGASAPSAAWAVASGNSANARARASTAWLIRMDARCIVISPLPCALVRRPAAPAGARYAHCSSIAGRSRSAGRRPPSRSDKLEHRALGGFPHLDPDREHLLHLGHVRDHEDLLEIFLDDLDRLDQPLQALGVLGAEALVDDERLNAGAGPARHQLGQRDPQGEVDSKCLPAAEQLVVARAPLVRDLDVQCLDRVALLGVALRL